MRSVIRGSNFSSLMLVHGLTATPLIKLMESHICIPQLIFLLEDVSNHDEKHFEPRKKKSKQTDCCIFECINCYFGGF